MRARLISFLFIGSLLACAVPAQAAPSSDVSLSLIRAIRISTSTVSLSFTTDIPAVGMLDYTAVDGSEITLTDSVPQVDHLFTVDELSSSHAYTFILTARADGAQSYHYLVTLSPEGIGAPGQGIMPAVSVATAGGDVVSAIPASSSTPSAARSPVPWWAFLFLIAVAGIGWGLTRFPLHRPF